MFPSSRFTLLRCPTPPPGTSTCRHDTTCFVSHGCALACRTLLRFEKKPYVVTPLLLRRLPTQSIAHVTVNHILLIFFSMLLIYFQCFFVFVFNVCIKCILLFVQVARSLRMCQLWIETAVNTLRFSSLARWLCGKEARKPLCISSEALLLFCSMRIAVCSGRRGLTAGCLDRVSGRVCNGYGRGVP